MLTPCNAYHALLRTDRHGLSMFKTPAHERGLQVSFYQPTTVLWMNAEARRICREASSVAPLTNVPCPRACSNNRPFPPTMALAPRTRVLFVQAQTGTGNLKFNHKGVTDRAQLVFLQPLQSAGTTLGNCGGSRAVQVPGIWVRRVCTRWFSTARHGLKIVRESVNVLVNA